MKSEDKISILLVDDHKIFLEGLEYMFEHLPQFEIVDKAVNGIEALDKFKQLNPEIIISDVSMPEMDGTELCVQIKKTNPEAKLLFLTTHNSFEVIEAAIRCGADGYLVKNATKDEFVEAISLVREGESYFPKETWEKYLKGLEISRNKKEIPKISNREKEILNLIVEGDTAIQIADKLFISLNTVNTHRKNLISKLGVKNTAGLVRAALQDNILKV